MCGRETRSRSTRPSWRSRRRRPSSSCPARSRGSSPSCSSNEGDTVDVGVPIISVDVAGEGAGPRRRRGRRRPGGSRALRRRGAGTQSVDPTAPAGEPKRQPVLVGYGVKPGATKRRPRKAAGRRPRFRPPRRCRSGSVPAANGGGARVAVLAKPPVRKLAKDLGVDLTTISGYGPAGIDHPRGHPPRGRRRRPARPRRRPANGRRAGGTDPGPGCAQGDGRCDDAVGVQRAACDRVPPGRRDRDDGRGQAAARAARVRRRQGLAVAARRQALLLAARRHPRINASWDEARRSWSSTT